MCDPIHNVCIYFEPSGGDSAQESSYGRSRLAFVIADGFYAALYRAV